MEHAGPQGPGQGVVLGEGEKAQDGARPLKAQGHFQHPLDQPHHSLKAVHIQGLLHQGAALDAHPAAGGQNQSHAHRRDAQAADLDQSGQHRLSKHRKVVIGVHRDEARDTDGAGGGEQRVDVRHLHPRPDGDGQHQKHAANQNHRRKAQGNEPPGGLLFEKPYHSANWAARPEGGTASSSFSI